ncbi:hypothetical protein ACIQ6V_15780 [Streptomyces sp. NPDC096198]|uniref:hypothetical protein n=1 Tax=Streptomyces sp. NPDC096198 TaxID=3366080 RepID=UPI0038036F2F
MLGQKAKRIRTLNLEVEMAKQTSAHFQKANNRLNEYIDGLEAELEVAVHEYTELEGKYEALIGQRDASQAAEPPF